MKKVSTVKVIVLGSGDTYGKDKGNFYSSFLVVVEYSDGTTDSLLINCGADFPFALDYLKVKHPKFDLEINNVYLSNVGRDHIGGLDYLGPNRFLTAKHYVSRPTLYAVPAILKVVKRVITPSLSLNVTTPHPFKTCFDAVPVSRGKFNVGQIECTIVSPSGTSKQKTKDSYGLMVRVGTKKILFASDYPGYDTDVIEFYEPLYTEADKIFHPCSAGSEGYISGPHIMELADALSAPIKEKILLCNHGPHQFDVKGLGFNKEQPKPSVIYVLLEN